MDDQAPRRDIPEYPGAPRWVKAFVLVTVVLLVLIVAVLASSAFGLHHVPIGHGG